MNQRESPRRRRRRIRTRWILRALLVIAGFLVLLAALAIVGLLHAIQLEHRLRGLPATLQSVTTEAESGRLAAAEGLLAQAENTLTGVNSALYNSLDFELLNIFPVGHENIRAIRDGVRLGLQMVGGGEEILQAASPLESNGQLAVPLQQGQIPLATVEAVQSAVDDVATTLPVGGTAPGGSLVIGPVRAAVGKVFREAEKREAELRSVAAGLKLVEDISGANGDKRYLIAVANSAEMRGSGGMILSYGVITSHAGKVTLVHVGPIDEIKLASPETTTSFPADFQKEYGGLAPTADWRNANMMSDFTIDAPVMAAMFQHATGQSVDGVIQVDSAGLAAILAGVGPVVTPALGTVTEANAVTVTLSTSYALYSERSSRQDYTGELAQAAFERLTTGRFSSLKPIGTAVVGASKQRHILVYTAEPSDETAVRQLGFDGSLPAGTSEFAQVSIQNFGGNKLDYYLLSSVRIDGHRPTQSGSLVTATIDLANTAPAGETTPHEVFGPFLPGDSPGEYYGLVTLYLPAGSFLRSAATDASVTTPPKVGSQNGLATVTFTVSLPAGAKSRVTLDLFIPPMANPVQQFEFVPSPRVHPTDFLSKLS